MQAGRSSGVESRIGTIEDLKRKLSPVRDEVDQEHLAEAYYALSDYLVCALTGDTADHKEAEAWARAHMRRLDKLAGASVETRRKRDERDET